MVVKEREKLCDIESNYTRMALFEPTSMNEMGEIHASVDGGYHKWLLTWFVI